MELGALGEYDMFWNTVGPNRGDIWISQFQFLILFHRIQVLKALALSYHKDPFQKQQGKQFLFYRKLLHISICMQCFCFHVFFVAVTDMLMICYCYLECIQLHTTDFIFVQRSKNLRL